MKTNEISRKLVLKKQTIAKLNVQVMNLVKGGHSHPCYNSNDPCNLTDDNYGCATAEYCVTDAICTNAQAVCVEGGDA